MHLIVDCEGVCRPNPKGFAAWAWVAEIDGVELATNSGDLGKQDANTMIRSAYHGIGQALRFVNEWGRRDSHRVLRSKPTAEIRCSQKIVVQQVKGQAKCTEESLQDLSRSVAALMGSSPVPLRIKWRKNGKHPKVNDLCDRIVDAAKEEQRIAEEAANPEPFDAGVAGL